ncbi:DUF7697 family protein [Sphingobium rhizovicinum]
MAGCGRQLRAATGGPFGLDFGAVIDMGSARRVDTDLLAQVLPGIERILLDEINTGGDDPS